VNAPERLAWRDITVPKRAQHIRVLMLELNDPPTTCSGLGPFLRMWAPTPFFLHLPRAGR